MQHRPRQALSGSDFDGTARSLGDIKLSGTNIGHIALSGDSSAYRATDGLDRMYVPDTVFPLHKDPPYSLG